MEAAYGKILFMLYIYDEGHVLFSTLAVVSGITQPSHDLRITSLSEGGVLMSHVACACALLFHCALSTPPSLDAGVL